MVVGRLRNFIYNERVERYSCCFGRYIGSGVLYLFGCEPCMDKMALEVPSTPCFVRVGNEMEINVFPNVPCGLGQGPPINIRHQGYSNSRNGIVLFLYSRMASLP